MKAWDRFWFAPAELLPLAFFRISLGLLLLATFLCNAVNWGRFYSYDGVVSLQVEVVRQLAPEDPASLFYLSEGILPVAFWWWVGLIASLGFLLGWRTRICTVVLFLLVSSMIHRARLMTNGDDLMFRMFLLHSCFAPLGRRLSLDAVFRAKPQEETWIWSQRMLQINWVWLLSARRAIAGDRYLN